MSYRASYQDLELWGSTVRGDTVSGNTASLGTSEIGNAELANNAASGLKISSEYGPLSAGSPNAYGQQLQAGNGTTNTASGLWVTFADPFLAAPTVVITSARVAAIVVSHPAGSITAGSFFAISEGASRAFDWIAIGSGR